MAVITLHDRYITLHDRYITLHDMCFLLQSLAESLKGAKGSLTAIQCDVTNEDQVLAMFEKIKKQFGGVDVCVNNAGLAHNDPILTGSTERWRHMFEVMI